MAVKDFSKYFGRRVGAYRAGLSFNLAATQAAASRLVSLRNGHATNFAAVTYMHLSVVQFGAFTAAIADEFRIRQQTGFTVDDNANNVVSTFGKLDQRYPNAGCVLQNVTVAGAAAGMTGGTWVNGNSIHRVPIMFQTASTAPAPELRAEMFKSRPGGHPLIIAPTEGLVLENFVLLGAAVGATCSFTIEWEEFAALS